MEDGMEKYGVEQRNDLEKYAHEEETCPSCGRQTFLHGRVRICPKCGSEPFEQ